MIRVRPEQSYFFSWKHADDIQKLALQRRGALLTLGLQRCQMLFNKANRGPTLLSSQAAYLEYRQLADRLESKFKVRISCGKIW